MGLFERAHWTAFAAWSARDEHRLPFRPPAAILDLQDHRVRAIIRYAYRSVPFYHEAMNSAGIEPRDIRTAADLRCLPMISGADLRRTPDRLRSSLLSHSDVLELRSTGTTGSPKTVAYDHRALFLALAGGMRQRHMLRALTGMRGAYREMTIARQNSVSIQMRDFFRSRLWRLPRVDLQRGVLDQEEPPDSAVERINRFRPHTLFGMGSHIGSLYRWANGRNTDLFRPKVIIYGGDRMADNDRELLESELGVAVVSIYQAVESLRIGFECEHRRGFHLSLDTLAVRVVDEQLDDVGPGDAGELVVSNLVNRATVLLNYRLGDRVRLEPEPCPCGRMLPTIELLEGRPSEAVLLPDSSTLQGGSILVALHGVDGVQQVQLEQEELRTFTVRAVLQRGTDRARAGEELASAVRSVLGADITVRVSPVDQIPPGPGGKVQAVTSRCLEDSATEEDGR